MREYAVRRAISKEHLRRALQLLLHSAVAKVGTRPCAFTQLAAIKIPADCVPSHDLTTDVLVSWRIRFMHAALLRNPDNMSLQAWRSWSKRAMQWRLLRAKGAAVAAALRHGAACRAWRSWGAHIDGRHAKKQQVELAPELWNWLLSLRFAWQAVQRYSSSHQGKRWPAVP